MSLVKAVALASEAHKDDMWGEVPYMDHLYLTFIEAVNILDEDDIDVYCAAILHDVIEDHPEYAERVREEFPNIYESLVIDSRQEGEAYDEFIQRVIDSGDRVATIVKLCDMIVNLGNNPPARLVSRYQRNINYLYDAVATFDL